MSHIPTVGKKHVKNRLYVLCAYGVLSLLGLTMVIPFMITISGSASNDYDYQRFSPIPKFLYSQKDRYVKGLLKYFNHYYRWSSQMKCYFPDSPKQWSSWMSIGKDVDNSHALAEKHLSMYENNEEKLRLIASDYSAFSRRYPVSDSQVAVDQIEALDFLRQHYSQQVLAGSVGEEDDITEDVLGQKALKRLSETWCIPYENFYGISFKNEMKFPMNYQSWSPPVKDPKYEDFIKLKSAYAKQSFVPGLKEKWQQHCEKNGLSFSFPIHGDEEAEIRSAWQKFNAEVAPATMAVPLAMRASWIQYLETSETVRKLTGLKDSELFDIDCYNRLSGGSYANFYKTPFPIPEGQPEVMQNLYREFIKQEFPIRLTSLTVDESLSQQYAAFLQGELKVIDVANDLFGNQCVDWSGFTLESSMPGGQSEEAINRRSMWINFVKGLPLSERKITCSEMAYQEMLLEKYGDIYKINKSYGWELSCIEEAFPPLAEAYTVTFVENEFELSFTPIWKNYKVIVDFLMMRGNAILVTVILVALTILATLTINPLCAYALSRFNLPGQTKIILFMLATMAFPAMVSAIPAYLLMRDLGMLNTFSALILPSAANGMAIFILKGFFDSLPQELFEAATIDGAKEYQIFKMVAMPMVKPILAINCVNAFIMAYNGWEWALIICQDQDMWTLAVWMYQASQWWVDAPWIVSSGYVVVSIPTMIVFLSCQRMILRGIVIPTMK